MALFVLSSKDGWVNIMYTGLDAVGVDQQVLSTKNSKSNFRKSIDTLFASEWPADRELQRVALDLLHLVSAAGRFLRAQHVRRCRRRELSPLP